MNVRRETQKHIDHVRVFINKVIQSLSSRAHSHDRTKLESPEAEIFEIYTPKLSNTTYGSVEYKQYLKEMEAALTHHYRYNRHHPENHEDGIDGMTLVDLVEMLCDWKAATLRHNDGDILRSVEQNKERFDISPQLVKILQNTVKEFGWETRKTLESEEMNSALRALGFLVPDKY